jgi:hypothetical protein
LDTEQVRNYYMYKLEAHTIQLIKLILSLCIYIQVFYRVGVG